MLDKTPPRQGSAFGPDALPLATAESAVHRAAPRGKALATLALGALGVVYGDIGTSPLYALRECFGGTHGVPPTPQNVLGIVSLVFWAMTFVITFKYLAFVMRADNRGEGGVLALMALGGGSARRCSSSACSAPRSSTATGSSPRRSQCSARSRGSRSRRPPSRTSSSPRR
jgi:KUP system potassium uptake protein